MHQAVTLADGTVLAADLVVLAQESRPGPTGAEADLIAAADIRMASPTFRRATPLTST